MSDFLRIGIAAKHRATIGKGRFVFLRYPVGDCSTNRSGANAVNRNAFLAEINRHGTGQTHAGVFGYGISTTVTGRTQRLSRRNIHNTGMEGLAQAWQRRANSPRLCASHHRQGHIPGLGKIVGIHGRWNNQSRIINQNINRTKMRSNLQYGLLYRVPGRQIYRERKHLCTD